MRHFKNILAALVVLLIVVGQAGAVSKINPAMIDMGTVYYPVSTASDQGVAGNKNTIHHFIDTTGTSEITLVLRNNSGSATTTYTLTTNETIPERVTLQIERGAVLDGAGTLTIESNLDINRYQIFDVTFDVDFAVETPANFEVFPEWWGAVPDDSTECSAAINAAILSLSTRGGIVRLGVGVYSLTSSILTDQYITIKGEGYNSTVIHQDANEHGITMGVAADGANVKFEGFQINCHFGGTHTKNGIDLDGSGGSIRFTMRDVLIQNFKNGLYGDQIAYSIIEGFSRIVSPTQDAVHLVRTAANNTNITIQDLQVNSPGRDGVRIVEGTNIDIFGGFVDSCGGVGYYLDSVTNFSMTGGSAENVISHGIHILGSGTGLNFTGTNLSTNGGDGIRIDDSNYINVFAPNITNSTDNGIKNVAGGRIIVMNAQISSSGLRDIDDAMGRLVVVDGNQSSDEDSLGLKGTAMFTFDYSDQATAGTWNSGVWLPSKFILTRAWYDVNTTFTDDATDATTIDLGLVTTTDILAAIAISNGGNPWDDGQHNAIPRGDDPSTYVQNAVKQQLSVTVAGAATLTAGKVTVFLEYVGSR